MIVRQVICGCMNVEDRKNLNKLKNEWWKKSESYKNEEKNEIGVKRMIEIYCWMGSEKWKKGRFNILKEMRRVLNWLKRLNTEYIIEIDNKIIKIGIKCWRMHWKNYEIGRRRVIKIENL